MSDSLYPTQGIPEAGLYGVPWSQRAVLSLAGQLRHGCLELVDGEFRGIFGNPHDTLRAVVTVRNPAFYTSLLRGGAVGASEAYMDGYWETDDLFAVIRILARNEAVFDELELGWGRAANWARRALHWLRRNTISGSRRNIHAHYDLGNEFFRLWLDPLMMYSSAIYPRQDSTLDEAAVHKLDVICDRLQLSPGDHLLEIGTGWGALAIHAAQRHGCRVTTTTISREQHALACARVREAGLEGRVEVLLKDYRELQGSFDKLVSVEMIEAVGDQYLETYFRHCSSLLKPEGAMLLQVITSPDHRYDVNKNTIDFVKRYIFPGGQAPSLARIMECVRRETNLRLELADDFGRHYARTLLDWRLRFRGQLDRVREQGYDERFIRMWDFYLSYCAGGFAERRIGVSHLVFSKPLCRLAWGEGSKGGIQA